MPVEQLSPELRRQIQEMFKTQQEWADGATAEDGSGYRRTEVFRDLSWIPCSNSWEDGRWRFVINAGDAEVPLEQIVSALDANEVKYASKFRQDTIESWDIVLQVPGKARQIVLCKFRTDIPIRRRRKS